MSLPISASLRFCEFAPQNLYVVFLAYSVSKMTLAAANVRIWF